MKKVFLILGLLILLTACGTISTNAEKEARFTVGDSELFITEDKETGCKYLIYSDQGGYSGGSAMTPLLKADGTVDCN